MKMWKVSMYQWFFKTPNSDSLHRFGNKDKKPVAIKIPTYIV